MDVAVRPLRLADDLDDVIQPCVPLRVAVSGVHRTNCFHPLIKIPVVEWRSVVTSLRPPRCDAEVFKVRLVFRSAHDFPHRRDRLVTASREVLVP